MPDFHSKTILITGATGYIGGRLLTRLAQQGHKIRCLARTPEYLRGRVPAAIEVVAGDVMDRDSLLRALANIEAAYYLIHAMGASSNFEELDRRAAHNFGAAAQACGAQRIIYLGGLGESREQLSSHLRSRQEVGNILASYDVPVLEFRASIVIGSGSLSFEMIRALVERLPVMITPRWVAVKAQPIAINDMLQYLVEAVHVDLAGHRIFEIGGADQVSYGNLMKEYARQRGLHRVMIPVPFLTPRLSSLWLGLVTPLYARVGGKLIDSLRHETIVRDDAALKTFLLRPRGVKTALAEALRHEDEECAHTRWSDAISASGTTTNWGGVRFGNRLIDHRSVCLAVAPEIAFAPIQRIGGEAGWYYGNWMWRLRSFLDLLLGGVGMRRGRRHPEQIRTGEVIDCWRVERFEPNRRLRLAAEMKLPGRAWLEFEVRPAGDSSVIYQTAIFDPAGLPGLAYWYGVYPLHCLVFKGMLAGIAEACQLPTKSRKVIHPKDKPVDAKT